MKVDFPSIKPNNRYRRLSNSDVLTGQQILNLLELATPAMQAFILLSIQETDEPITRLGMYGGIPLN